MAKKAAKNTSRGRVAAKKRPAKKNSLVANINRRKNAGKSRPKSRSTISDKSYDDMEAGWPDSKTNRRKKAAKKSSS